MNKNTFEIALAALVTSGKVVVTKDAKGRKVYTLATS